MPCCRRACRSRTASWSAISSCCRASSASSPARSTLVPGGIEAESAPDASKICGLDPESAWPGARRHRARAGDARRHGGMAALQRGLSRNFSRMPRRRAAPSAPMALRSGRGSRSKRSRSGGELGGCRLRRPRPSASVRGNASASSAWHSHAPSDPRNAPRAAWRPAIPCAACPRMVQRHIIAWVTSGWNWMA